MVIGAKRSPVSNTGRSTRSRDFSPGLWAREHQPAVAAARAYRSLPEAGEALERTKTYYRTPEFVRESLLTYVRLQEQSGCTSSITTFATARRRTTA